MRAGGACGGRMRCGCRQDTIGSLVSTTVCPRRGGGVGTVELQPHAGLAAQAGLEIHFPPARLGKLPCGGYLMFVAGGNSASAVARQHWRFGHRRLVLLLLPLTVNANFAHRHTLQPSSFFPPLTANIASITQRPLLRREPDDRTRPIQTATHFTTEAAAAALCSRLALVPLTDDLRLSTIETSTTADCLST